ncbi:helix-turn-helix domain-containing protein [Kurthia sibirica]|uniref:RGS domain-containing protein n=1 Tax=Kurthia sibirica TaxID=202750 RepID=A0A2U3AM41_9BACL|nr:helix-turn-helix domain-containing protein [Kurthia sibirica]PWI25567.1 hypothetical protein DEX24_08145 [Kurthia sibirica]GEK33946.1 hypothetical protein KSI01_14790 [Kurthia sibirica]
MNHFFLTDKELLQYDLFKHLLLDSHETSFIHLSEHLQSDQRTMKRYVKYLQEDCANLFQENIIFEVTKDYVKLTKNKDFSKAYYLHSLNHSYKIASSSFALFHFLIHSKDTSIIDISEKIHLSTAQVYRLIHSLNKMMGPFNVKISLKASNGYLVGEETAIRYLLFYLAVYELNHMEDPFHLNSLNLPAMTSLPEHRKMTKQTASICHYMLQIIQWRVHVKGAALDLEQSVVKELTNFTASNFLDEFFITQLAHYDSNIIFCETKFSALLFQQFLPSIYSDDEKIQFYNHFDKYEFRNFSTARFIIDHFAQSYELTISPKLLPLYYYQLTLIMTQLKTFSLDLIPMMEYRHNRGGQSSVDNNFVHSRQQIILLLQSWSQIQLSKEQIMYVSQFLLFVHTQCSGRKKVRIFLDIQHGFSNARIIKNFVQTVFSENSVDFVLDASCAHVIVTDYDFSAPHSSRTYYFADPQEQSCWDNLLKCLLEVELEINDFQIH